MGFSKTATHAIWFIALIGASGLALDTFFEVAPHVAESHERRGELAGQRLHTQLSTSFCWTGDKLSVTARNVGFTRIDLLNVTVVVDGLVTSGLITDIDGVTGVSMLSPRDTVKLNKTGVSTEPQTAAVFTAEGTASYAVKTTCPELTTIVVSPASATMQMGETQDFHATGYDQFGALLDGSPYTWTTTCGTASDLNATYGRLTTGTTAGACEMTATSGAVSGSAAITILPGEATSVEVTPDPVDVAAGGTQTFTATARDQYGNVNSSTPVSWSTTAGSITSGGVLTAQTTAQDGLGVTATAGALVDTATVNVVAGPIARIAVAPSTATVDTGATQAFTAAAYDQYDNLVGGTTFAWSATRGSIAADGTYTAPSTTGADTVTASADGVDGQATVTVQRTVHVDSLATYNAGVPANSFRKGLDTVEVRASIVDHLGAVVAGASVTVEYVNGDGVVQTTLTGTTDASGVASVSYALPNSAKHGAWTARVTSVSGTDLVYDAAANVVTSVGFTVTPS